MKRSFQLLRASAVAALVAGGIALAPGQADATCIAGCGGGGTPPAPAPMQWSLGGSAAGAGMTDIRGGFTGSGPGLTGGVVGAVRDHTYSGVDANMAGQTNFCGVNCSDFRGGLNAYAGAHQSANMVGAVAAGGHAPAQASLGTLSATQSGASVLGQLQPLAQPPRPR